MTATGRNLGEPAVLPPGFRMSAFLSRDSLFDSGDLFLGDLSRFRDLDQNGRFVYQASFALP